MKYERIIVDVSNLYWRAYSTSQTLTAEVDGEQMTTGGIYTSIRMLQKLRAIYLANGGRMFYLFDNATSQDARRVDIDPDYKANRAKQKPQFYRGLDYLYMVLQVMNDADRLIRRPGSEADDLVRPVIESFSDRYNVLLVSNDMDWARMLSENVHWMVREDKKDVIYTPKLFEKKYGFTPSQDSVIFYKSIRGDVSDNIPVGVKNIREEMVLDLMKKVGSVDKLYPSLQELDLDREWKETIEQSKGRVLLNYQLVSFQELGREEVRAFTEITQFNAKILAMLYRSLKFNAGQLDSRLAKKEKVSATGFFKAEKMPRA